jgi:hypothetical protein
MKSMTKLAKNIVRGAGAVVEILPSPKAPRRLPLYNRASSTSEALRGDWDRVGNTLRQAFETEKAKYVQTKK